MNRHVTTTSFQHPHARTPTQDLEKQNMALCDRFLGLFAVLRARLDGLEAHTASLEGHCQSIHARCVLVCALSMCVCMNLRSID